MNDRIGRYQFATLGLHPSFGFGDRIGCATPGHVEAIRKTRTNIAPIFAQQSARELARLGRTTQQVIDDAERGITESGWDGRTGADADHLKSTASVDAAIAAGFTFFTIDPSDDVDASIDGRSDAELCDRFPKLEPASWRDDYRGTIRLETGASIVLSEANRLRVAAKYGRAIDAAIQLAAYIRRGNETLGRAYEIELSIDETSQPTTLAEHFIIASECLKHGVKLVSLSPRFAGTVEKAIDYRGDLVALEKSVADHAAIADMLGPYKISLHSGSDKLSIYPLLARATRGRFHVKTSGTSYLEALRVAARYNPSLFRRIVVLSRRHFESDRASYDVSVRPATVPATEEVSNDCELEQIYLGSWDRVTAGHGFTSLGRQILHCTYASVLTHVEICSEFESVLKSHAETYRDLLCDHFAHHLDALHAGL